jgi:predicted transcriptional regulator
MTVTIHFPPELEESLRQYAARSGQDVSRFVLQAVEEKIAKARTFDEISAPFAEAVAATGVSDEEFDQFFDEVRDEVWQDKNQGKKP